MDLQRLLSSAAVSTVHVSCRSFLGKEREIWARAAPLDLLGQLLGDEVRGARTLSAMQGCDPIQQEQGKGGCREPEVGCGVSEPEDVEGGGNSFVMFVPPPPPSTTPFFNSPSPSFPASLDLFSLSWSSFPIRPLVAAFRVSSVLTPIFPFDLHLKVNSLALVDALFCYSSTTDQPF